MRWARTTIVATLLFLLAATSSFLGFVTAVAQNLPDINQFEQRQLEQDGAIFAHGKDGRWVRIATLRSPQARVVVDEHQISPLMKQAIVAIEDRRYYQHRGVDPEGILRAAIKRVTGGAAEGGSTITQQLVKNVYLSPQQSLQRKLREAAIAYQLEQRWSKDKILAEYLNTIYFGHGCYGVEVASRYYFGKHAKDLGVAEAALLAAIPKSPTEFDPIVHPQAATARRNLVIDKMVEQGYVPPLEGSLQKARPLLPAGRAPHLDKPRTIQPYFVDYVIQQLVRKFGTAQTFGGGLRVYTTLDLGEQALAERSVATVLRGKGPQGSLVSIEPATGQVKAMVGGSDYRKSQYNVATSGQRQPGSSFKPFVLLAALDRGIQPQTEFMSKKQVFTLSDQKTWVVTNDSGLYSGLIPLTTALRQSDNTVFAQLTLLVGPSRVGDMAHRLGIESPIDSDPAVGLGGLLRGVTPLEMAHAYATIANGGTRVGGSILWHTDNAEIQDPTVDPISIERVIVPGAGAGGRDLDLVNSPRGFRAVDRTSDLTAVDAMRAVISPEGTGKRAEIGRPAAGKTGTTENNRDAWFAGFTPQRAAVVWVGYVNPQKEMQTEFGGQPVQGGTFPALIWRQFMLGVHRNLPVEDFSPSPGVNSTVVNIDTRNLELAPEGCGYSRLVVMDVAKVPTRTSRCSKAISTVPSFFGYTKKEMLDLRQRGFGGVTVRLVPRPAAAGEKPGTVVAQDPEPYKVVPLADVITVYIAEAVTRVVVPDVSRTRRPYAVDDAISRLVAAGFRVRIQDRVRSGGAPPGRVVGQDPDPRAPAPRGSVVTIRVTGTYRGVIVPRVQGKPLTVARRILERLGLHITVRRPYGAAKVSDVVYLVDPGETSLVPKRSSILVLTDPRELAAAQAKAREIG